MKFVKVAITFLSLALSISITAQISGKIDLTQVNKSKHWMTHDAFLDVEDGVVHLKVGNEVGFLYTNQGLFSNGTIEFDLKGKDVRGENFVGLAFHMEDPNNYDAIYFRPFNFFSKEKANNAVQYISYPGNGWRKLRTDHPGVYENAVQPKPDPNDWFHVTIIVNHPSVEVFVNNAKEATLKVDQISSRKKGMLGFWVSYKTEGWFKNLVVTPEQENGG